MPVYNIHGIDVRFPYDAYPIQLEFMKKVIGALQTETHALLESPTGTGKTLCLLCATLAWREHEIKKQVALDRVRSTTGVKIEYEGIPDSGAPSSSTSSKAKSDGPGPPRVYYTSRTHSQLTQVIKELRNTGYQVNTTVIGSREFLCVNPKVKAIKGSNAQSQMCRRLVSSGGCTQHNNTRDRKMREGIADIEDIANYAKEHNYCPFYISRNSQKKADQQKIDLENSIIIFDEAHNLESVCMESVSVDLAHEDLVHCLDELKVALTLPLPRLNQVYSSMMHNLSPKLMDVGATLRQLFDSIQGLERQVRKLVVHGASADDGRVEQGEFMFRMLEEQQINWNSVTALRDVIDVATQALLADAVNARMVKGGMLKVQQVFNTLFRGEIQNRFFETLKSYKLVIRREKTRDGKALQNVLGFWCLHASVAMGSIERQGVRSMILASGTLSPIHSFRQEMGIEVGYTLENDHVVDQSQVFVGIVPNGPNGIALSSAYETRKSQDYQNELGRAVAQLMERSPEGALGFFPSYAGMDELLASWKRTRLWDALERFKSVFLEPKSRNELPDVIDNFVFKSYVDPADPPRMGQPSGSALFAVCRGKVSEGIDFADYKGRLVLILGIPYPSHKELRVKLKREFLDGLRRSNSTLISGADWYAQQAIRAVNQAIGRVIRHRNDYGAILLLDHRFSSGPMNSQLSKWIRPFIRRFHNFTDVPKELAAFYANNRNVRGHLTATGPPHKPGEGPSLVEADDDASLANTTSITGGSRGLQRTNSGNMYPSREVILGGSVIKSASVILLYLFLILAWWRTRTCTSTPNGCVARQVSSTGGLAQSSAPAPPRSKLAKFIQKKQSAPAAPATNAAAPPPPAKRARTGAFNIIDICNQTTNATPPIPQAGTSSSRGAAAAGSGKYRDRLQSGLGADATGQFDEAVLKYKKGGLSVDGLMDLIFELFAAAKSADLFRGFTDYLPKDKQRYWKRRINTYST
ncbi:helicase C-terminal domain-domain-containing protein [Catenaria anguillulae PL171]|uniref:Regulator of telomere elongation helicase 1 homolog n=1 Tax=Catenaria anguillulae PL171 TaxID=765915 RepID=A0A1Y2I4J5_9FUNG|nr:helicase C-terminal domain-domain-containing protein [Catenaria anguillulae PL171]